MSNGDVESNNHECDLFLLSSHGQYTAERSLSEFARQGNRNIDGWGIGSYVNGRGRILKDSRPALQDAGSRQLSNEFTIAVDAVSSPTILGHLRLTSHGGTRTENNHPFQLNFLGYDWLLIHNGSAHRHNDLVAYDERLLLETDSDTPRVFEFLRQRIINYCASSRKKSMIEGCRKSYVELLSVDPRGKFNIILSNGYLSFIFIHWRPFYLLNREKDTGDVALISTIRLTDDEEWLRIDKLQSKQAKMLVFCGPTLVFNGDIPT